MVATPADIDEIDAKILNTLLKAARTSFAKIARDCGVSNTTIVKHFHKLQQSGVITGTSLITRLKDFGYQFPLAADINVTTGKEQEVMKALRKIPNFRACFQVIGKYDIHSTFYVENIEEIEEIRDRLKNLKSIIRVGLTATLSELSYFPENLVIEPTEKKKSG
jgi:DNA-binding Lrp family transcriptional regulator